MLCALTEYMYTYIYMYAITPSEKLIKINTSGNIQSQNIHQEISNTVIPISAVILR